MPSSAQDEFIQFEWMTIECIFYSMMTSLTRLSSTSDDPKSHIECLDNSRKCLFTLKALLETASGAESVTRYYSSLAW